MSDVYLSCFDYQENYIFFLKLIQTHISVSQGNIRFEKNAKIKMLEILEGIFHVPFNHYEGDPSFVGASSNYFISNESIFQSKCMINRP